jgi:hypothetical protein
MKGVLRVFRAGRTLSAVEYTDAQGSRVEPARAGVEARTEGGTLLVKYPLTARAATLTLQWQAPVSRLTR